MAEARARGYDVKVLKKLIALRKRDRSEVSEEEADPRTLQAGARHGLSPPRRPALPALDAAARLLRARGRPPGYTRLLVAP